MTTSLLPARNDIQVTVGDDFSLAITVTEDGSAYSFSGATVATGILLNGAAAGVSSFTTGTASNVLTLSLTDAQTTTLGVGVFTYYVEVTKNSLTRTWMAGLFAVRAADDPSARPAVSSAELEISTGALTLQLTSLAGTADAILTLIKTVDGAGSGLDADLLDGVTSASFVRSDAADEITNGSIPIMSWDADGVLVFGPTTGIDASDPGNSRQLVGYVTTDTSDPQLPPGWHLAGVVDVHKTNDPAEVFGWRSAGESNIVAKTTLAAEVADVTALSGSTLSVVSATGFGASGGKLMLQKTSGNTIAVCTYTGRNTGTNTITGVTYESGVGDTAFASGSHVNGVIVEGATVVVFHGQSDQGRGGRQFRNGSLSFGADEDQTPDGYGGYNNGGYLSEMTPSLGPRSRRIERRRVTSTGLEHRFGSWAEDTDSAPTNARSLFSAAGTIANGITTIPNPATNYTIKVDDPGGFPTSGTLTIITSGGAVDVTYTGHSATAGEHYFTGCSGGTPAATIADGAFIRLAKINLGNVLSTFGNAVFYAFGDNFTTTVGRVGPTTAAPEAGIQFGLTGAVALWRESSGVMSMLENNRLRGFSGTGTTAVFEARVTGESVARAVWRASGGHLYSNGTDAGDVLWKRNGVAEMAARNAADNAYADIRCSQLRADGALRHAGTTAGFFATTPVTKESGVAVTAEGIHAALVRLGLIAA